MDEQYDTSDHSDFLQHAVHKSQHNDVMPEQRCCGATTVGRAETHTEACMGDRPMTNLKC